MFDKLAWQREDRKANPDRTKEYNRLATRRYRNAIIEFLGGKCCKCGFSDIRALQIDHINGGGSKELKSHGGGNSNSYLASVLKKLKNGSKDYQLLCANCNWIKRYENYEYVKAQ